MSENTVAELTGEYIQSVRDALTAAGVTIHWEEVTVPDAVDLWLTPIEADAETVIILGWRENEGGWYTAECPGEARFTNHRFRLPLFAHPESVAREAAARLAEPIRRKEQHPADGSDRWSVTGEAGQVRYDRLGNHLALIPTFGEPDSVMGLTLRRVREYAELDDDEAVFALLRDVYRTEILSESLRSGDGIDLTRVVDVDPDRVCRRCGATQGLKMLFGPPGYTHLGWECYDGCAGGAQ